MSDNSSGPAHSSDPAHSSGPPGVEPVAWLRVATPYPGYADAVVADISRIVATASGRAVFEAVRASGHSVLIERPSVRDPPNAAVQPQPGGEDGRDCTITYEPAQWPNPIHPPSQTSDVMLFRLLRQALAPLQGRAEPGGGQEGGATADETAAVERYLRERDGE